MRGHRQYVLRNAMQLSWVLCMLISTGLWAQEDAGCTDPMACNYDADATGPIDPIDCDYCSCPEVIVPTMASFTGNYGYGLHIDLVADHGPNNTGLTALYGMRTFRFYAVVGDETSIVSAVTGSTGTGPLVFTAPEGFYQHPLGAVTGAGILPLLFESGFPELAYDSWVTIGIDQEPAGLGPDYASISTIAAEDEDWISTFEPGLGLPGSSFFSTNNVGGGWFTIPTSLNSVPDSSGRILLGQFTSSGDISGSLSVQFQPSGAGNGDLNVNFTFDTEGLGVPIWTQPEDCPCESDADGDGICAPFDACGDVSACNYADPFNAECLYTDACGLCGGSGFPEGTCDCDGTPPDALGICGGSCTEDLDQDDVCDVIDPCVGDYDDCGVCNGPGEVYDCGCNDILPCACDCAGNQLDALGICGGDCPADLDFDGICDDIDPCIGSLDACGICNGPGAIFDCGCAVIPAGDCDCNGNQPDALGICGGTCSTDSDGDGVCDSDEIQGCTNPFACNYSPDATDDNGTCLSEDAIGICGGDCPADVDGDGICDDEAECVGSSDACGVCNGPGAIYACGCSGIPAGDCDCNGNQPDALGICGGTCAADEDGDGVCDANEVPGCTNAFACNYSAEATEEDGSCLSDDAIGICGGTCTADLDGDGICDEFDPCVGALDMCGICNGPGAVFDCGCSGIPVGDCDCDGNQTDALGVCGGACAADADGDGVCDDVDPCVGSLDECGFCNGPGAIFDCGCAGIPAGDCDCDGNQPDALGICGGPCSGDIDGDGICDTEEVPGCTDGYACNFDAAATDADGSCLTLDAVGECGGSCAADADGDGICDDVDPCIGATDVCGVCNGPGAIFDCGCSNIPNEDCDCDGNQPDAVGVCGGACLADSDGDGICDSEEIDGCIDPTACNYEPSATDQGGVCFFEDAIGVCGGGCPGDEDGDGICDTEDTCLGTLDVCGVCNGPGATFSCGCAEIEPGACDCDGNMPDAVGVCDGECESDDNQNGVCDDLEAGLCGPGSSWNPLLGLCVGVDGACPSDLDGNGSTGAADLLIFLTEFGTNCTD